MEGFPFSKDLDRAFDGKLRVFVELLLELLLLLLLFLLLLLLLVDDELEDELLDNDRCLFFCLNTFILIIKSKYYKSLVANIVRQTFSMMRKWMTMRMLNNVVVVVVDDDGPDGRDDLL